MKPKKRYGQNFLKHPQILSKIVNFASCQDKNVLEIGPGQGDLTVQLCKVAKKVVSVEIDESLDPFLFPIKENYPNFNLIYCDFLKLDLEPYQNYVVVGNIPYNISSPIIIKLVTSKIEDFTLLVQSEYADRICGQPGTKNNSSFTALISYYGKCKKMMNVKNINFYPVPSVDSTLIKFERSRVYTEKDEHFLLFLKTCFSQKRKFLISNINLIYNDKEKIINIFNNANITTTIRAESLSINDYINLYNLLYEHS
ncbi:MAG: 16S rRNA (adenine(1518)-N(6)/adenine(1519)-N(6))-dimethyltransferase RsmA [Acholeplasmatales bacterium]|jgi:16S rRNA (adenine1518-N6/adenine1519-N6)-dimethyltransferase|nr:16S rRNA (adenine(1518)-N(6)/adenine(1519)-N(6))-dimethyltransferase RsmA [Acholeplasmatales bacterium]